MRSELRVLDGSVNVPSGVGLAFVPVEQIICRTMPDSDVFPLSYTVTIWFVTSTVM